MSLVRLSLVLFLYQMLSDYEPDIGLLTSCLSGYYSGFSMIGELLSEFFLLVSLFQAVPNQWTIIRVLMSTIPWSSGLLFRDRL